MAGKKLGRDRGIDALRGIAILMVLSYHYIHENTHDPLARAFTAMGWSGVDLFFVLSGFLIGGNLIDHLAAENYYAVFYARRALRIIPLYILVLAISSAFAPTPWPYFVFAQNVSTAVGGNWGPPLLLVTWSLALEEQFYWILPLALRLARGRIQHLCIGAIVIAVALRVMLWAIFANEAAPYVYKLFPCRMDEFFFGVLAAWQLRRGIKPSAWLLVPAIITIAVVYQSGAFVYSPTTQILGLSALAFAGYYLVHLISAFGSLPLLPWFGVRCYGIYLLHLMVPVFIFAAAKTTITIDTPLGAALAAFSLAVSFGAAALSWRYLEAPLTAIGHRFSYSTSLLRAGKRAEEAPAYKAG